MSAETFLGQSDGTQEYPITKTTQSLYLVARGPNWPLPAQSARRDCQTGVVIDTVMLRDNRPRATVTCGYVVGYRTRALSESIPTDRAL